VTENVVYTSYFCGSSYIYPTTLLQKEFFACSCGGLAPAGSQTPIQPLARSPPQQDRGENRKNRNKKVHGSRQGQEDNLSVIVMGNADSA